MNRKLITLLTCLGAGDVTVLETTDGDYLPFAEKCLAQYPNAKQRSIEGRLMYELFGEYPLSPSKEAEWELAMKGLKFTPSARAFISYDAQIGVFRLNRKDEIAIKIAPYAELFIVDPLHDEDKYFTVKVKAGCDVIESKILLEKLSIQ